jgi:cytochrome c oxidase assembly protein subunit 15
LPDAARLWFDAPWWRNLFENTLTVPFDHRMVAYGSRACALARSRWLRRALGALGAVLAATVVLQACLGIMTLLSQAPLGLALLHQAGAIVVLVVAVVHAAGLAAERRVLPARLHSMQAAR